MKSRKRAAMPVAVSPSKWATRGPLVVLAVAILLAGAVRLRLADVPLERDEGEYAYFGQLILDGVPPYAQAYNMKFPGTYYAYAAVMAVFGETARGIHLGLLVVNALTTVLVFVLARRLIGPMAAAAGAAVFATLSLDRFTLGVFGHATHFVILMALIGWTAIAPPMPFPNRRRSILAGCCFGLAVLLKQQAIFLLPGAALWLVWRGRRDAQVARRDAWTNAAALVAGAALSVAIMIALLAVQGVLERFWFWTIQYAAQYASANDVSAWPAFLTGWQGVARATRSLWLLAGVGGLALVAGRWNAEIRVFVVLMAVSSAAAMVPGLYFREHYFILILPVVALLAGFAFAAIDRGVGRMVSPAAGHAAAAAVAVAAIALYAVPERAYLTAMSPAAVSRSVYGTNPFVEAPEIARYLREHTNPGDRIAVVGSEPEIYFYADRRAATGYIYTYALMEPQPFAARMQDEMIREIEAARPRYMVGVQLPASWLMRPGSNRRILSWFNEYANTCYEPVGAVETGMTETVNARWDADVAGFTPRSSNVLVVHRRRTDSACQAER